MQMLLLVALLQVQAAGAEAPGNRVSALVSRARAARYQQDSALASYQAIARQRGSAGIGLARGLVGAVGRERLAARFESVARVGWHHEQGAWGEVIGARGVAPIAGEVDVGPAYDVALVLPYYPGRDRLWPMSELREAMHEHGIPWIVHPLDAGSDSVYSFVLGDSLGIRLPDGGLVSVRELRVRPRRPASELVVGSLWVDIASGSLVRAAYRPSVPMDLLPFFQREVNDEGDLEMMRKFGPFTGTIREILVEHGLYEGRFWLPRTRIASAEGHAKGLRATLTIEQSFRYERVNALSLGESSKFRPPPDDIDPRTGRVRRPPWYGEDNRAGRCRERGDTSAINSPDSLLSDNDLKVMHAEGIRFRVLLPCRRRDLVTSAELPPSIYDPSDKLFTDTDLKGLRSDVEGALSLSSQAEWQPLPATIHYGLDQSLIRYNRIEGLSAGIAFDRVLGSGYTTAGSARIGVADLQPNAELSIARSNVRTDLKAAGYRRLVAAGDWGDPLGLGASAVAAVFGRDDGFYYRTLGAEVRSSYRKTAESAAWTWRLFAERQDSARVETHQSVAHLVNDHQFRPNITALAGMYYGGTGAVSYALGSNPTGTRLSGALRAEGAAGEIGYGRFLMEHTLNQGLGFGVLGSVTAAGGTSAGSLPPQRLWYLGDAYTVRGHRAGEMSGDAFWIGRAELAKGRPMLRPAMFADAGWAGARTNVARQSAPLLGVGAGATALDGLVRLDISHGLERERRWRADFYFEVR
ncbi:MAG: ShlB/FhaC/HecB family hemolysin secretion/activation protein [Gemmatimonadaceae bacterium]